jgi:hypothetical protein
MSAASAVRIEAGRAAVNRENAQFSTGPRTPEGKQRSSLNATSHGLTAKRPVLRSEDPQVYQEFCRNLIADLKPQGALEQQLAQNMADTQWRLLRCRSLEQSILMSEHQPSRQIESLAKFSLYEQRLTRNFLATLKQFRELQAERAERTECAVKGAHQIMNHCPTNHIPYDPALPPTDAGFVFSAEQPDAGLAAAHP